VRGDRGMLLRRATHIRPTSEPPLAGLVAWKVTLRLDTGQTYQRSLHPAGHFLGLRLPVRLGPDRSAVGAEVERVPRRIHQFSGSRNGRNAPSRVIFTREPWSVSSRSTDMLKLMALMMPSP